MSMQRNIQPSRLTSSAPCSSTSRKHVHFREIQSAEPKRSNQNEYPTNRLQSSVRNGPLFLVDCVDEFLQQNRRTLSSDSSTSATNTPDLAHSTSFYRLPEDLLARGDFIAYQGANVADFFNLTNPTKPKCVSEICLVNDYYILVKIPAAHWGPEQIMDRIAEEECNTIEEREQRKGFLSYLPYQRSRRVSPTATVGNKVEAVASGIVGKATSILKCPIAHCWRVNEQPEVFESRTRIFDVFCKQRVPGKVITIQPSKRGTETPLDLRVKPVRTNENGASAGSNSNQVDTGIFGSPLSSPTKASPPQPLPVIDGALQSSLHDTVTLEQHATWINNEDAALKQCVNQEKASRKIDSKKTKTQRRTNVLRWFIKRPKACKPKSKIHAVVHKTYFVRWKKPPDEMCPHCGRSRSDQTSAAVPCKWRRCQSATF